MFINKTKLRIKNCKIIYAIFVILVLFQANIIFSCENLPENEPDNNINSAIDLKISEIDNKTIQTGTELEIININLAKSNFIYDDKEIGYDILNGYTDFIECSSYGYLQKKNGDAWDTVPSTKPNGVAWCATMDLLNYGEKEHVISFLDYNGTLSEGTYKIVLNCFIRSQNEKLEVISDEFILTGEFPMTEGKKPPVNIFLASDNKIIDENSMSINYKIINESDRDIFIFPIATLALYKNSEWINYIYTTDTENEFTSSEDEIHRSINIEKLPDGLKNCTKIRIIEQVAIPIRNVFYAFYEIDIEK